ncbi:glycerophosphodiester phosphodiesterase family protein [Halomonas sabkhae]|uniref:glycerophosphodiester phosphodiesterase family protein n=1 Tax=Halomonas sabkhae TaxID=626223 RepID=UPI0025B2D5FC|nr:glycerophosphodiester phosphodiesterase family protein [Halomonas sabkhae]MDN3526566.1 glycerophosphodiester phosphodiesterase family protein [Halomonas sabkhae]
MTAIKSLGADVLSNLRQHLRPLIAYHLFYTILASSLLLPAAGWTLAWLLGHVGHPLISNADLVAALLTPAGLGWLLVTLGVSFLLLYLQQAGMTLVAIRPRGNHYRLAFETLVTSARRLPALSGLVIIQVGSHLLLLLPVVLAVVGLYQHFLGNLESYYIQQVKPPALWWFAASSLPLVVLWCWLAGTLYARWHLALPAMVLEELTPRQALRRSVRLTHGQRRHIAGAILLLLAIIVLAPIVATRLFDALFTPLITRLPERQLILLPAMLGYVGAYVLLTLAVTFLGIALNALLGTCVYQRLAERPARTTHDARHPAHPGRLAWAVEIAVVVFALSQAWLILNRFEIQEDVEIIAHRGSSAQAPENTLAAIELAMRDGADSIEVDARLTGDGQVVLHHDATLRRLAGDPRRIDNLGSDVLAGVDVGSWFGDAFVGEPIATLTEALERTRGQTRLMIELKPSRGRESELIAGVEAALEAERQARADCRQHEPPEDCGPADPWQSVSLAALSYDLLNEVQRHRPEARTTLLAQLVMRGTLPLQPFDTLALRHNRITLQDVKRARRNDYRLYAWTVNDPARMARLIDLGVDGIITDRPGRLKELLAERAEMSDGALMLGKLRHWVRD